MKNSTCQITKAKKQKLKDLGLYLTKILTPLRLAKLSSARQEFGFCNIWTIGGRIGYLAKGSANTKLTTVKSF